MRKFIAACFIALSCLATTAAPTLADSFSVTVGERGYHPVRHNNYRPHRPHYREHCRVKTVRYRHHGRWIVKRTRVCR